MKIFSKLIMLVLVAALAGPFFLKGPDGRPLMTLQDLHLPSFSLPSQLNTPLDTLSGTEEGAWIKWGKDNIKNTAALTTITDKDGQLLAETQNIYYRWKDKNDVWQFTKQPNPDAENFLMQIDPNANIIQSLSQTSINKAFGREPEAETLATNKKQEKKSSLLTEEEGNIPFPASIPIDKIPQLIDQAKNIQTLSNERQKIIQRL